MKYVHIVSYWIIAPFGFLYNWGESEVQCDVKALYDVDHVTWSFVSEALILEGSYCHYFKFCIQTWT